MAWWRRCRCGHQPAAHAHYRPGSDCGLCDCGRWRRRILPGIRRNPLPAAKAAP